jgi:hypothetical protein
MPVSYRYFRKKSLLLVHYETDFFGWLRVWEGNEFLLTPKMALSPMFPRDGRVMGNRCRASIIGVN